LNTGERDLLICCILFDSPYLKQARPINRVVRGGQLEIVEYEPMDHERRRVQCVTGEAARAIKEGMGHVRNQECHWYLSGNPELASHFDLDANHATFDGTASVVYRPIGDDRQREFKLHCKCIVMQRADANGEFSYEILPTERAAAAGRYLPTPPEPADPPPPSVEPPQPTDAVPTRDLPKARPPAPPRP
jgi:hypothetical protein